MNKDLLTPFTFEKQAIRRVWHNDEWFFSAIDIVGVLSESNRPRKYWNDMKIREPQLSEICGQLKMYSSDGKKYETDAVNFEGALRLIQSVPSKKAEPLKLALANLAKQKLEEIKDPSIGVERAIENFQKQGYLDTWIQLRLISIQGRKFLTDIWKERGIDKPVLYGSLTNTSHKETYELSIKEHMKLKNLDKKHNLRDNFSEEELAIKIFEETVIRKLHEKNDSQGLKALIADAKIAGASAKAARESMEQTLGRGIVCSENALEQKWIARQNRRRAA